MQLFLLGAGTTAGKPAQLLHVLVTAADYCFVYNGSTVRPRVRPGPVVLGAAHTRRGTWARQDAAAHSECPRHGKPFAALGFCSLARGVHGEASFPSTTPLQWDFTCNINHFRARSLVRA